MPITLLDCCKRVARKVGLDPSINAFSEADETLDIVQDINEAYEELIQYLPKEFPYLNASASMTLIPGQRLYNLPVGVKPTNIYKWSFLKNLSSENSPVLYIALQNLVSLDSNYLNTKSSSPQYVYFENVDQIGVYPIPSTSGVILFNYSMDFSQLRLASPNDTFARIPDKWLNYVEKRAQEKYERRKGFANPDVTLLESIEILGNILLECWEISPTKLG